MLISKIIMDIVELKQKHNLLENNWTFEGQVDWLLYSIPMGLVVVKYEGNELKGYLEYVRVDTIPTDINNYTINFARIKSAPIGFVTNMIADNLKTLSYLKGMALKSNPDVEVLCWHSKKRDRWFTMKRSKE